MLVMQPGGEDGAGELEQPVERLPAGLCGRSRSGSMAGTLGSEGAGRGVAVHAPPGVLQDQGKGFIRLAA